MFVAARLKCRIFLNAMHLPSGNHSRGMNIAHPVPKIYDLKREKKKQKQQKHTNTNETHFIQMYEIGQSSTPMCIVACEWGIPYAHKGP